MQTENQNIEYKSSWHDDYLQWICGFANAQGGRIYIGKSDSGKVVGVENYKRLLDEIPNKTKNLMGITVEVNLLQDGDKYFIEIVVLPYSVLVSLRGRYYYRSGSVKQELTGAALNEFLLKRAGQTWDNVIEPRATFADIDEKSVQAYLVMSNEKGRYVLERLDHKYFIKQITFEGMYRIEKSEYPVPALREMLINSLVHRSYMGSFIQIRVYDNKINIWNDGTLPEGVTLESLLQPHSSKPRNLLIADVCFKGGLIDAWGRGTIHIIDACKKAGLPEPELKERDGGFLVTLFKNNLTEEQLLKLGLNQRQIKAMQYVKEKGKITNKEYQTINECSRATANRDLSDLVEKNILLFNDIAGAGANYVLKPIAS